MCITKEAVAASKCSEKSRRDPRSDEMVKPMDKFAEISLLERKYDTVEVWKVGNHDLLRDYAKVLSKLSNLYASYHCVLLEYVVWIECVTASNNVTAEGTENNVCSFDRQTRA